jgi:peroxiredoxin Q/BCP
MSASEFRLQPGDLAPDFSLLDQNNNQLSLTDLKGQKSIIYFYPAAGSPGCSKEAADFQDALGEFEAIGYRVIGISPDPVAKLKEFEDSHQLTFSLLSDPDIAAHKAYGAFGEKSLYGRLYRGVLRSTIVVDENGVVTQALYNVKATGHTKMLLRLLA